MKKNFKINPKIRKDKSGNPKEVYLDIDVYNAIIKDMDALKKQIQKIKKAKSLL